MLNNGKIKKYNRVTHNCGERGKVFTLIISPNNFSFPRVHPVCETEERWSLSYFLLHFPFLKYLEGV